MRHTFTWPGLLFTLAAFSFSSQPQAEAKPAQALHASTGFKFPAAVGPFRRTGITDFRQDGSDVGASYQGPNGALTVYVYPERGPYPAALDAHFKQARGEIRTQWKSVRSISQRPLTIRRSGQEYAGREEVFLGSAPQIDAQLKTWLVLFKRSDHFVKFRFTCPLAKSRQGEASLREFIAKFAWPQRSAGCEITPPKKPLKFPGGLRSAS